MLNEFQNRYSESGWDWERTWVTLLLILSWWSHARTRIPFFIDIHFSLNSLSSAKNLLLLEFPFFFGVLKLVMRKWLRSRFNRICCQISWGFSYEWWIPCEFGTKCRTLALPCQIHCEFGAKCRTSCGSQNFSAGSTLDLALEVLKLLDFVLEPFIECQIFEIGLQHSKCRNSWTLSQSLLSSAKSLRLGFSTRSAETLGFCLEAFYRVWSEIIT